LRSPGRTEVDDVIAASELVVERSGHFAFAERLVVGEGASMCDSIKSTPNSQLVVKIAPDSLSLNHGGDEPGGS
jgi:hypothetical protein